MLPSSTADSPWQHTAEWQALSHSQDKSIAPFRAQNFLKTWYWLRYPNCPPPTFKCMTQYSGCQVLMPIGAPLPRPRWLWYLIRHPMEECSRGHMPFQPSHLPKSDWHAWVHFFRVKGLGFPPTVTKVGQGAMMLGACND